MKSLRFLSFSTLLLLAAGPFALAQQAGEPPTVTLQNAIQIALRNQVDIIAARNNTIVAQGRFEQAKSDYFPQVALRYNAFTAGSGGVLSRTSTGAAVVATQNVWDGGLREANVAATRYGITQSTASLTRTAQAVIFNVTGDYYNALRSKRLADVAAANVRYSEELKAQVQAQAEIGTSASADVLPVESQLANARVSLITAQNNVLTSLIQLQNTMGLAPRPGFDIVDVENPPQTQLSPLQDYVSVAVASRPDITGSRAALGAAKESAKAARINLYPRPVITAEYQEGISGGFSSSGGEIIGGIAFDVFNGGANRAALRQAKASQATAQAQVDQVYKDIQAEVEQAYLNLTSAQQRLAASEVGLAAAQSNYEAQKQRYAQGVGITLDLLNAEVQLVTAQSNEVQARYDYYTAVAQLEFAVGRIGGPDAS